MLNDIGGFLTALLVGEKKKGWLVYHQSKPSGPILSPGNIRGTLLLAMPFSV